MYKFSTGLGELTSIHVYLNKICRPTFTLNWCLCGHKTAFIHAVIA